jgi:type I restriction enzyme S subunit
VDELIAAQARKLDALKTHKKGLMQQLFPREGETQPRLRFPEFQNAGEWVIRFVSQLAKVTTGAKDTQNKVEGGRYPFFVRSQTVERIDSYSYDGEAVLTSGDGVGVGKNFHYIKDKFDFHQRVYCIYDFDGGVSGLFFYLYFSEHFGERVMRMSAKNSVDSVRMAMITEMPVTMPSLPEQQRIADCLTSLDALIAAQTQKHEALKTHKKGLMQQLFPSPEVVEP